MTEDYGANIITIVDDEGNEIELEYLDTIEYNGQTYLSFFPTEEAEGDESPEEEQGLIILKQVMENGEELLSTLDSDEELEVVYEQFMASLFEDEDENE